MRTLDSSLTTTQQASPIKPAIKVTLTSGATEIVIEEDRIKSFKHIEEPWQINAKPITFNNSDNYFDDLDLKAYKAVISYGAVTKAGKKYSDTAPMWVRWQQFNSSPGALTCELTLLGIPDLMDLDKASATYIPTFTREYSDMEEDTTQATEYTKVKEIELTKNIDNAKVEFNLKTSNVLGTAKARIYKNGVAIGTARTSTLGDYEAFSEEFSTWVIGDLIQIYAYISSASYTAYVDDMEIFSTDADMSKTVKTLIREIAGDTGVTKLACFSHCTSYDVVFGDEETPARDVDDLIDSYKPKDSFRIYIGSSRLAAMKRLLECTKCVPRFENDGKIHIFVPVTTGTTYDYEYSLKDPDIRHAFFNKAYRSALVIPNRVVVQSQPTDNPQYSGEATSAASYALLPISDFLQMRLSSNAEATSMAEAVIANAELNSEIGSVEVPMNCGAEVFDYIKATDERQGDSRTGNLGSIIRTYTPSEHTYSMRFSLGDPPMVQYIRELANSIQKQTGTDFISRLRVGDLYAERIQADSLDMIWIDPEGNVDLSQIGDTLDSLPDGETYARVKSLHLDAGQIKMDENIFYSAGYDASEKRRTFTATPTTPYDVGDLWLDASVVKRCTTARATGAYVAGDWTATTLDAIANGTTYARVLSSSLTAGGLVLLDQVSTGTYGLVLETDISAGHILLSTTVKTGEWYNESGVSIDAATGINLYGTNNALTTRATKTGTIQCFVGSDGCIYAGAGAVKLSETGADIKGLFIRFLDSDNVECGYVSGLSTALWVRATGENADLVLQSNEGNITLQAPEGQIQFVTLTGLNISFSPYLVLPQSASDPSTPGVGWMYYNTTSNVVKIYNGTAWKTLTWS